MRLKETMIYNIVTQILKMINFSSSPVNQLPNHGLRAGAQSSGKPKTSTPAGTSHPPPTQSGGTPATQSEPQANPPFPPSPGFFGTAHPPVLPPWGPFSYTESTVLYDSLPCNSTYQNDSSSELNNLSYNYTSFDSSTNNSVGSACVTSGGYTPPVYGPDR